MAQPLEVAHIDADELRPDAMRGQATVSDTAADGVLAYALALGRLGYAHRLRWA